MKRNISKLPFDPLTLSLSSSSLFNCQQHRKDFITVGLGLTTATIFYLCQGNPNLQFKMAASYDTLPMNFQIFVQSKMGLILLNFLLLAMTIPSQGVYRGNALALSSPQGRSPVQNLLNNADRPLVRTKEELRKSKSEKYLFLNGWNLLDLSSFNYGQLWPTSSREAFLLRNASDEKTSTYSRYNFWRWGRKGFLTIWTWRRFSRWVDAFLSKCIIILTAFAGMFWFNYW